MSAPAKVGGRGTMDGGWWMADGGWRMVDGDGGGGWFCSGDDEGSDEPFEFPVLARSGIRSTRRRVARRDRQMRSSESSGPSESGFVARSARSWRKGSFAAPGREVGTAETGRQADDRQE